MFTLSLRALLSRLPEFFIPLAALFYRTQDAPYFALVLHSILG
jgi:hypothetical protein